MILSEMTGHAPVLFDETMALLEPKPGETFIDCTAGAGGHSAGIAERISPDGGLVLIDRDEKALSLALSNVAGRPVIIRPMPMAFGEALGELAAEGLKADGVLFDLGLSSMQIDEASRGFSYMSDGPLDMRMDKRRHLTAAGILNRYPVEELARIFRQYGEEKSAAKIAAAIARQRQLELFERAPQLVAVIDRAVAGEKRSGHSSKRVFQALRIEVNDEMAQLRTALDIVLDVLNVGGRVAFISFHSLEDRLVKRFMNEHGTCHCPPGLPVCACRPRLRLLTHGAVKATAAEAKRNPRSHSARLRAAEVIA